MKDLKKLSESKKTLFATINGSSKDQKLEGINFLKEEKKIHEKKAKYILFYDYLINSFLILFI